MRLKCFALYQPFATLCVIGAKLYETRGQQIPKKYRGLAGILATKDAPDWCKELFEKEPFKRVLTAAGYGKFEDLPTGLVIGTVNVVSCLHMVNRDDYHAPAEINLKQTEQELAFGEWRAGRFAIGLKDAKQWQKLYPARGQQSILFEIEIPESYLHE